MTEYKFSESEVINAWKFLSCEADDLTFKGIPVRYLCRDTLDLINRQNAEIERKGRILDSYALQYGTVADKDVLLKRARSEAVKEFAEMLKKEAGYFDRAVAVEDIDNLVKEMVGEQG